MSTLWVYCCAHAALSLFWLVVNLALQLSLDF